MPLESLLAEGIVREAERRFGSSYLEQDELGRLAIVTALAENEVSHARIVEVTGAHSRDVTLKLQDLMRKGLLNSDGPLRQKSYFLPPLAGANGDSSEPYDASSAPKVDSSGASGGSSEANGGSSAPYGGSSTAKVDSSTTKVDSSGASGGSTAPYGGSSEPYDASSEPYDASSEPYDASSEPYDASSAVTRVRDSKRAPPELVGAAIEELCEGRYLSLDVLAGWLKRNRNTLRNLQVPRLISEGRLELRYPDSPTHPQQAYRTKKELES